MDEGIYNILNKENYYQEYDDKKNIYFYNYINIVCNYLQYIIKNNSSMYNRYIIHKGLELIGHVFKILLLYTKNINLTNYHSQKAYFYFIEFTSQIKEENNIFLNLTLKDATLFVYRKTIFLIDDNIKKHNMIYGKNEIILNLLNNQIIESEGYIKFLIEIYFLNNNPIKNETGHEYENNRNTITIDINKCINIVKTLITHNTEFNNNNNVKCSKYTIFNTIIYKLFNLSKQNNITLIKCEKIILRFLKKIQNTNNDTIETKLHKIYYKLIDDITINNRIQNMTPIKFINYIHM